MISKKKDPRAEQVASRGVFVGVFRRGRRADRCGHGDIIRGVRDLECDGASTDVGCAGPAIAVVMGQPKQALVHGGYFGHILETI